MIQLDIHLNGDGCWADLADQPFEEADLVSVALLQAGTTFGKPSVSFRVETADGNVFIAQTTLALLLSACDAFKACAGDPRR